MEEILQFVNSSARNTSYLRTLSESLLLTNTIGVAEASRNVITEVETMEKSNNTDIIGDIFTNEGAKSITPGSGELPWYGYMICIGTMLFIWVVGSAGNFLVVYVVCKDKQLQTPINMFLVNLSLADFITSALGSPFPLLASIMHRWPFGEMMCIIYAFGMSLGGITSITTLMVLAFERYLMIARPFRAADIKIHHASAIIVLIWVYSLALTIPPLIGWSSYGPEGPYISCSVSWERDDIASKSYICFLFVLGLVLPLITIVFSYIGIVTTIKSTSQAQVTTRSATARAELRVTAMVAVMISCFLLAWSPYAIVSLVAAFGGPKGRRLITPVVSVLPAIFAKSATVYNPLIYVGLNTQFQNAWLKLFGIQRESDENQSRLTLSASAAATTVIPNQTLGKGQSVQLTKSPPNSTNSSTQNSPSFIRHQVSSKKGSTIPQSIVLHRILQPEEDGKLNKPEKPEIPTSAIITTQLELVPLNTQERQDLEEQTQENNDIHSST